MTQSYNTRKFLNHHATLHFDRVQPREWRSIPFENEPGFYDGRVRDEVQPAAHVYALKLRRAMEYLRARGLYRLDVKVERITKREGGK